MRLKIFKLLQDPGFQALMQPLLPESISNSKHAPGLLS